MISFEEALSKISGIQLMHSEKVANIYQELLSIPDGDLAEVGVYRGATALLMRLMHPSRTIHLYDTFCGIKGSDPNFDIHLDGEFSCCLKDVQRVIGMQHTKYHVGMFPGSFREVERRFAFIHSDTDTYLGTKATIDVFGERMEAGGKIMFDDYQWVNCPGVDKAINESAHSDRTVFRNQIVFNF